MKRWLCTACREVNDDNGEIISGNVDSQQHVLTECVAYRDLREEHDINTDKGLVDFFRQVIARRMEIDSEPGDL